MSDLSPSRLSLFDASHSWMLLFAFALLLLLLLLWLTLLEGLRGLPGELGSTERDRWLRFLATPARKDAPDDLTDESED